VIAPPRSPVRLRLRLLGRRSLAWTLGLLLLLGWLGLRPAQAWALNDAQQVVVEAWRLVNQSYVDPERFEAVQWRRLRQKALERPIHSSAEAHDAIAAMLEPLGDPYTRLLRPEDYAALRASTEGSVCGVGMQLGMSGEDQRIRVITAVEGSPAAEAGITTGSELLEVDGVATRSLGLQATAARLRGPAGSSVQIRLLPPDGGSSRAAAARELVLRRRLVALQPVRSRELTKDGHRLGYLRIAQFSEPVPERTREALAGFVQTGVEGLILDLRNDSGGLVEAGLAVANAFLENAPIVETLNREGISEVRQATPGRLFGGPMVTLVNGGTASASEILAGALQDDGRSLLLGSRTFGKGLIQTLISLGDGSGLAVTVARYVTPSGRDIQNQGIVPDRELAPPEPLEPGGQGDRWLELAIDTLLQRLDEA
jgi:carboxyl-terminal processing protease